MRSEFWLRLLEFTSESSVIDKNHSFAMSSKISLPTIDRAVDEAHHCSSELNILPLQALDLNLIIWTVRRLRH